MSHLRHRLKQEDIKIIFNREPALILGVVSASITLVTAFGIDLNAEQVAGINVAVVAICSLIVRQKVTPVDA